MTPRLCALSFALATLSLHSAHADVSFVNGLAIPAITGDQFGTAVNDGRLGMFSDLYYDTHRNEWWGLSDRGPGGGTIAYETRVQRFTLDVNAATGAISNFKVQQTVKFSSAGVALNGLAPNPGSVLGNAFDPEGFVISPTTGHLLVSDEYGPSLYEFDRNGSLLKTYTTPAGLVPRDSVTGTPSYAGDPAANGAGKRTNRGFEGLAISPDGRFAYAMLQSAMLDEGAGNGAQNRIVKFDADATSATYGSALAQYAYTMEGSSQGRGISALVALDDHRFMVLERNNRGVGVPDANLASPNKKVFLIDIAGASDVSAESFAGGVLPASVVTVAKNSTALLDLAADTLGELGGRVPEKWEGLTVGPKLVDGSYLLLAGTDNDYSVTQNGSSVQFDVYFDPVTGARVQCDLGGTSNCTEILANGTVTGTPIGNLPAGYTLIPGALHAYKASEADLGGYLAPVPEPETYALMLGGLGLVGWVARRRRPQRA